MHSGAVAVPFALTVSVPVPFTVAVRFSVGVVKVARHSLPPGTAFVRSRAFVFAPPPIA